MTDRPAAAFAHASEAEMGRILDFYGIAWQYEPHTFPILWNLEGDVVESFSPDFYLPDLDLYLEMTTLRQKLARKKNRKLRRLRELYPDVRIKLFYARDFRALMLKYGKLALVDTLSGSAGQVVARTVEPAIADGVVAGAGGDGDPVLVTDGGVRATAIAITTSARRRRRRRAAARAAAADGSPSVTITRLAGTAIDTTEGSTTKP